MSMFNNYNTNTMKHVDRYSVQEFYKKLSQKNVWSLAKHMNGSQSFQSNNTN